MGAVTKAVKKIIPKEIQPILPFAASMFGGPLVGAGLKSIGVGSQFLGSALGKGLTGGITNLATQALTGGKISPRSAILSGLMSGGGSFLRSTDGLAATKFGQKLAPNTLEALQSVGQVLDPAEMVDGTYTLTGTGEGLSPITRPGYAALTVGGAEAAYQTAEEEQRKFEEEQAASEASQRADMASRAEYLRNYAELAGYSQEEINDLLDRYGYSGYRMGGRVGFEIGGMSDLGKLFSKVTGKKPTEESLMDLRSRYAKEIENQMISELDSDYPSVEILNQIRNEANRQADMALNKYMESLGMEPFNPPEGSVGADVIEQIMGPRKEDRVEEANGGRIKKSIGGLAFAYDDYLRQADELGLSGDPMSFEDFTDTWLELQSDLGNSEKYKNGGRIGLREGGTGDILFDVYRDAYSEMEGLRYPSYVLQDESEFENKLLRDDEVSMKELKAQMRSEDAPIAKYLSGLSEEDRKKALRLLRDKYADLGEYYKPEEEKYLEKRGYMKDGGLMNLKMGGMPMEMDLRGGGFVPIGRKERADDVPARLSKNEFVMTADAVRAAGGGSVNKGAKRMYDLMNKLEARV